MQHQPHAVAPKSLHAPVPRPPCFRYPCIHSSHSGFLSGHRNPALRKSPSAQKPSTCSPACYTHASGRRKCFQPLLKSFSDGAHVCMCPNLRFFAPFASSRGQGLAQTVDISFGSSSTSLAELSQQVSFTLGHLSSLVLLQHLPFLLQLFVVNLRLSDKSCRPSSAALRVTSHSLRCPPATCRRATD